ncbi:MAG TPA: 3-methyl-2-oxobutanoate hydroxymethyltransferase [Verrucomicrobiae bacterium]|jgi:3-methyl-2-oxobutanoate hydroxymethyltransferase|nr:3-methyl-2-oxobutanoate hydroxymethyltransferase [Verrucomicrobiae bacterium]
MTADKVTRIRGMKGRERIAALTAYDFPMAKVLDATGVPLLLVGDSLGMVVLGYPDTTCVTMADMEHHVRAAARAKPQALLAADLPYGSCATTAKAVENARRLIAAGAEAVKAEGGRIILAQIEAILAAGIPFLGHLGMLPQNAVVEGGYHIKGKKEDERLALIADALALEQAGAFGLVLELVAAPVAREITAKISIPTIGIGSGPDCDGEILVTTDLLGTSPGFVPKHVKKNWHLAEQMRAAVVEWKESVVHPGRS